MRRDRSPLGTYLVTMHRQGIAIWGGPSWKRLIRLQHPAVEVRFCVLVVAPCVTNEHFCAERRVLAVREVPGDILAVGGRWRRSRGSACDRHLGRAHRPQAARIHQRPLAVPLVSRRQVVQRYVDRRSYLCADNYLLFVVFFG
jgi:hypothetical protein